MRIFLTGATGYIGSAVLDAVLRAGHDVTALARTPERAARRGVTTVVGDLSRPDSYAAAVDGCDAIVHTAFEATKAGALVDRQAVDALLGMAARVGADHGRAITFVYTSGVWVLGNTATPTGEEAVLDPPALVAWRPEHEQLVLDADRNGVRTVVIRPGVVYGGARGIIGEFLKNAVNGLVRVVGSGRNHMPCIYDRDLADLYVRVLGQADAHGIFHATDEADERVEDIVGAIARHLRQRPDIRYMPIAEARTKQGPYADALALDQLVRSPRARALGWTPTLHSIAGNVARLLDEFRTARAAA